MQCPVCAAYNHPSSERCSNCGADLFEPAPNRLLAKAGFVFALGALFLIDPLLFSLGWDDPAREPRTVWAWGLWFIYRTLGTWPPVIVPWGVAGVFLIRALTEGLSKRRRRSSGP
jgi:hypothetical protein